MKKMVFYSILKNVLKNFFEREKNMKKVISLFILVFTLVLSYSLIGCGTSGNNNIPPAGEQNPTVNVPTENKPTVTPVPVQLSAPVVTLSENGLASWQAVANATKYVYVLNGGNEVEITNLSLQLNANDTLQVKAIGDGNLYLDSVFSNLVRYEVHQHVYSSRVTKDATCSQDGIKTFTCACGDSYTEIINKLGHTEAIKPAVAPTCTEKGKTEGKHCSVCNTVTVAQEEIPALGHTEVVDAMVAATCTEKGKTEGKHCSVCNTVTVAQEEIPALGHTEVVDVMVAATCTESGKTEGKHCSVCNTVTVAQEEIPALGHTEVVDAMVAATCTETGKTEGKHCSVCNTTLIAQEEIAVLGHDYLETWSNDNMYHWHACSRCETADKKEIHVWDEGKVVTEPTEEASGVTLFTCTICEKTENRTVIYNHEHEYSDELTYDEEGHWYAATCGHDVMQGYAKHEFEEEITTESTCEDKGLKTFTCGCGYSYTEEIAALGHDEVEHDGESATCTEEGYEAYVTCTRCDYTTYKVIEALGHDEVEHEEKNATCTEDGHEAYVTCSRCDYTTYKVIEALGHDEVEHEGESATCTEEGNEAYVTCSRCDYTTYKVIEVVGHKVIAVEGKDATCSEVGYKSGKKCETCGKVIEGLEEIPTTDHSWDDGVITTKPTESTTGIKTYTCENCDETKEVTLSAYASNQDVLSFDEFNNLVLSDSNKETYFYVMGYVKSIDVDADNVLIISDLDGKTLKSINTTYLYSSSNINISLLSDLVKVDDLIVIRCKLGTIDETNVMKNAEVRELNGVVVNTIEIYKAANESKKYKLESVQNKDFELPVVSTSGYEATWVSNHECITIDGTKAVVTRGSDYVTSTISVFIKYGEATYEKQFEITVYPSIDLIETATHEEYIAAENDTELTVRGIVIAVRSKSDVYLLAEDGAYYLYGSSIPEWAVLGNDVIVKGVKTTYNGTHELKNVTLVEVVSADNSFEAVDVTEEFGKNGFAPADSSTPLDPAIQGKLVKFTGVYNEKTGKVLVNGKEITVYNYASLPAWLKDGLTIEVTGLLIHYYNKNANSYAYQVGIYDTDNVKDLRTDLERINADKTELTLAEVINAPIKLTLTGSCGSEITWSVVSGTSITITDNVMTVTRPASGKGDATVKLQATLKLGSETVTKEFEVTVEKMNSGELVESSLAVFEFGENGSASHEDGKTIGTGKQYESGEYTLTLENANKVYDGARDQKGNSALKLGTSSVAGSFTFTVDANVTKVVIYVAKYKNDSAKVNINNTQYTINGSSNDGAYDEIVIDTTTNKTISFTGTSKRCMIDKIEFIGYSK